VSVVHAVIPFASGQELDLSFLTPSVAVAPEGRHVAYVSRHGDSTQLYLRAMDRPEAIAVEGVSQARMPFFSPDGQWLGFLMDGKLMKSSSAAVLWALR
jgi:Tol biopolymer transport system component